MGTKQTREKEVEVKPDNQLTEAQFLTGYNQLVRPVRRVSLSSLTPSP